MKHLLGCSHRLHAKTNEQRNQCSLILGIESGNLYQYPALVVVTYG